MSEIIFNSVSSKDIGIEIETFPEYVIPEKNVDSYEIPGRNGSIVIDHGTFKNVDLSYKVSAVAQNGDYSATMHKIAAWLFSPSGYARLEDTYDSECYRMAKCSSSMTFSNIFNEAGQATIKFNAMPQRYLKIGETSVDYEATYGKTKKVNIFNPTLFTAKPLVCLRDVGFYKTDVYGSFLLLKINGIEVKISLNETTWTNKKDVYYDFEDKHIYTVTNGVIKNITGNAAVDGFKSNIELKPGDNVIEYSSINYASLSIIPRWWTI